MKTWREAVSNINHVSFHGNQMFHVTGKSLLKAFSFSPLPSFIFVVRRTTCLLPVASSAVHHTSASSAPHINHSGAMMATSFSL